MRERERRGGCHIQVYLSFIQQESLELVCNSNVLVLSWVDPGIIFEYELV